MAKIKFELNIGEAENILSLETQIEDAVAKKVFRMLNPIKIKGAGRKKKSEVKEETQSNEDL